MRLKARLSGVIWLLLPLAALWAGEADGGVERLRADVEFLASDALEGREAGKPGNDAAALFIKTRLTQLGFQALPGAKGMLLPFDVGSKRYSNVAAWIPGPREEVLVVGAHFDHIGHGEASAMSKDPGDSLYNGANDNASGVAGMLEMARHLAKNKPETRGLVIIAFNAEEKGLFGSADFCAKMRDLLQGRKVVAMINLDMIGLMPDGKVQIMGAASSKKLAEILDLASKKHGLQWEDKGYIPLSDHHHFYTQKIPCIFAFCGISEHYHGPNDEIDTLNYKNMNDCSIYLTEIARYIVDSDESIDYLEISKEIINNSIKNIKKSMSMIQYGIDLNDNNEVIMIYKSGHLEDFNLKIGYKILAVNDILFSLENLKQISTIKPHELVKITVLVEGKRLKSIHREKVSQH